MPRATRARRWALFVEGTRRLVPTEKDALSALWTELCDKVSESPPAQLEVHGFSKGDLVAMDPTYKDLGVRLDAQIAMAFDGSPFEVLLVAFDAHPKNQALQPQASGAARKRGGRPCRREETHFVLRHFAQSPVLPEPFKRDARELLVHYEATPKPGPRSPGRPPRSSLDLLYMDPEFESLLAADDAPLLALFQLSKRPKDWPRFPASEPKDTIARIIDETKGVAPRHLRRPFRSSAHAWALEILRRTRDEKLLQHPIAARLGALLA